MITDLIIARILLAITVAIAISLASCADREWHCPGDGGPECGDDSGR